MHAALVTTEDQLQKTVAQYLDAVSGNGCRFFWFHVPNGGRRNIRVAGKLKSHGVKAGVWDCALISKGGKHYWIELKKPGRRNQKNAGLSTAQVDFKEKLVALGVPEDCFTVADSLDDVESALRRWQLI